MEDSFFVKNALREVSREISPDDRMHVAGRRKGLKVDATEHYFNIGLSAMRCIEACMVAGSKREFRRILDLPSGHGRVLRFLRAGFPESEITACDLLREGVDYCAQTFGARPVYSHPEPEQIELLGRYDLIWCGSLLTHLPESKWDGFLKLFAGALEPDGILVFTTHGRQAKGWLQDGTHDYNLSEDQKQLVIGEYEARGFSHVAYGAQHQPRTPRKSYGLNFKVRERNIALNFASYPDEDEGYGITFSSPSWTCGKVAKVPNLRLIAFNEHGWAEHQDVVACGLERLS